MDLKEAALLGEGSGGHWYYLAKGRMIRSLLPARHFASVLDVGAGSGVFARQLLRAGVCQHASCIDVNYTEDWAEREDGREIRFLREPTDLAADLVLIIDVLEHVDDDAELLRGYSAGLADGTLMVITVPAFQWLWSDHDEFLEHRRRYTLRQVERLVEAAGLHVLVGRYFFAAIFPLAAAMRLLGRLRMGARRRSPQSALRSYRPWLNRLLIAAHAIERRTIFRVNRAFGLTVVCLAEKGEARRGT